MSYVSSLMSRTNDDRTMFYFLNALPTAKSKCKIRIYLHWNQLFYKFGLLLSPYHAVKAFIHKIHYDSYGSSFR